MKRLLGSLLVCLIGLLKGRLFDWPLDCLLGSLAIGLIEGLVVCLIDRFV